MIFDKIEQLRQYRDVLPDLEKVCSYLETHDIRILPDGRNEIEGDSFFVNISRMETEPWENREFEAHRLYADIQYVIDGTETIGYLPVNVLGEKIPYDPQTDLEFLDGDTHNATPLVLTSGMAAVFLPGEAHKPCCKSSEGTCTVHKAVFKLRIHSSEQ